MTRADIRREWDSVPGSDLARLVDLDSTDEKAREAVDHTAQTRSASARPAPGPSHRSSFDPRVEYWRPPERRLLVAYLADRWSGRFAPPAPCATSASSSPPLRPRAHRRTGDVPRRAVRRRRRARSDLCRPRSPCPAIPAERELGHAEDGLAGPAVRCGRGPRGLAHGIRIPTTGTGASSSGSPGWADLGATDLDDLRRRLAFFYGYANLWTMTNAYKAGPMAFASVLQNTKTDEILDRVDAWRAAPRHRRRAFPRSAGTTTSRRTAPTMHPSSRCMGS